MNTQTLLIYTLFSTKNFESESCCLVIDERRLDEGRLIKDYKVNDKKKSIKYYHGYIEREGGKRAHETCMHTCMRARSCPTLWDPMDCSLQGSAVHGILQARILEWVAIFHMRHSD